MQAECSFLPCRRRRSSSYFWTRSIAVFANMLCLILLPAILALRYVFAGALSGEKREVDLFLDSDVSSLPQDDSSSLSDNSLLLSDDLAQWPVNSDNPSLNQLSPVDQSDNIFDGTEPVELAGVNNLCAADKDTSMFGKMRARGESSSCTNPDTTTNQLKLPDWNTVREQLGRLIKEPLFDFYKKDDLQPVPPPPLFPSDTQRRGK